MMQTKIIFISLCFHFLILSQSIAQNSEIKLHLISFADTYDKNIGVGCSNDLYFMKDFFVNTVGKHLGIEVIDYNVNNEFHTKKLVDISKQINIGTDDIVVFFYSGHGYRYNEQDVNSKPFPYLAFNVENRSNGTYNLEGIHQAFEKANPRLVLTIGDLCNSIAAHGVGEDESIFLSTIKKETLRKLFVETEGEILLSSSAPNEKSWVIPADDKAISVYTYSFLKVMERTIMLDAASADWQTIANETESQVEYICKQINFPTMQNPIDKIFVNYK